MGLVDLKTNLKSLRYGNDRPGGGSSGQPYITTPIPDGLTANGPDFLLRQGALEASLTDSERLFKFFFDPLSPRGLLFTAKQIALERQNIPAPGTPNRIYLPTSTIAQAGLNAVGGHLNKRGLDPFTPGYFTLGTESDGYFKSTLKTNNIVSNNSIFPEGEGRLTVLYKTNFIPSRDYTGLDQAAINFGTLLYGVNQSNDNILLSYNGGPNALLGLGKTNIRLQNPTVRSYINLDGTNPNDVYTFQSGDFAKQVQKRTIGLYGLTDYRVTINQAVGEQVLPATVYNGAEGFNREQTYKTSPTFYKVPNKSALFNPNNSIAPDELNATSPTTLDIAQTPENDLFNLDLIKFFFEVINPAATNTPSDYLFFRAYLNSIGDNFKGEWQPYKYVGRAENFYKYTGFSRDVSLSFIIYAHSRAEMKPLYEKLNYLVGTTAPTYSGNGYMLGNLIKLTVGTYFNSVPGIINNISLKPSFEAGWDINRDISGLPIKEEEDAYLGQIPRMIEVDLTFTPIHDFTPQSTSTFINNTPIPKPPQTETPSNTPNTIDEPVGSGVLLPEFQNPITPEGSGVLLSGFPE